MSTPIKHNHFPKLLLGITFLFVVCIFACNGSGSSTEQKDTSSSAAKDSMKMKADSTKKTDTSGKGGQPTPGGGN